MGGGALSNWGAHALDWCFYLFGPELTLSQARLFQALNPGDAEDSFLLFVESDQTLIEIEYLNCAAKELPRWHVVGRYGTAVSQGQSFSVRYCDPSRLCPLEADEGMASDGRYGITEDLSWTEETLPLGHWDNCPPFFNQLYEHLIHGAPPPITSHDVLAQLKLMERVRMTPLRKLDPHSLETIRSAGRLSLIANGSLG
jgi:predicted dehydrogenase